MKKTTITKHSIAMTLGEMLERLGVPKDQWVHISIEFLQTENRIIPVSVLNTGIVVEWEEK